jgi:hypothetical protein
LEANIQDEGMLARRKRMEKTTKGVGIEDLF